MIAQECGSRGESCFRCRKFKLPILDFYECCPKNVWLLLHTYIIIGTNTFLQNRITIKWSKFIRKRHWTIIGPFSRRYIPLKWLAIEEYWDSVSKPSKRDIDIQFERAKYTDHPGAGFFSWYGFSRSTAE